MSDFNKQITTIFDSYYLKLMLKLVEIESEMMSIKKIVCIDVMKLDIRITTSKQLHKHFVILDKITNELLIYSTFRCTNNKRHFLFCTLKI